MKQFLNRFTGLLISPEDRAFATAKAINRKCPVYMFRENWR